VNVILFMLLGDYGNPYYANPLLNIFVFGLNADSVANDLGMLLASGVLKTVSCEAVFRHFSATVSQRPPSVHPGPVHLQHHGASSGMHAHRFSQNLYQFLRGCLPFLLDVRSHPDTHILCIYVCVVFEHDPGSVGRAFQEMQVKSVAHMVA